MYRQSIVSVGNKQDLNSIIDDHCVIVGGLLSSQLYITGVAVFIQQTDKERIFLFFWPRKLGCSVKERIGAV